MGLVTAFFKGLASAFFGFIGRQMEIMRAKKSGANEQSLKNQEKANEQLEIFQDIDVNVSDDDAIDGLFGDRESK